MTKILTGGLLLAAILTTTALPSQATCAWVLWKEVFVRRDGKHVSLPLAPIESFATQDACNAMHEVLRQRDKQFPDPHTSRFYRCLPDTVDPREK